MKRILALAPLAALALAACSSGTKDDAADPSKPVKREAGNWRTELKLVNLDLPGMPPEMINGMKSMMEKVAAQDVCLTKEQAEKEDMANELAKQNSNGADCTFSRKNFAGGNVDIAGSCKDAGGRQVDMEMKGTIAARKTEVMLTATGAAPTGTGTMKMQMQINSTHTGPCKAG